MEKKEYDKALLEAVLLLLEKAHAGHHPANSDYGKYLKAVEALKQPQATQEAPKPTEQKEYVMNVWRHKRAGHIEGESFNTKEDAETNIRETDKDRWQLIGQHHGTYEVEK
jgi:hypothetical protein